MQTAATPVLFHPILKTLFELTLVQTANQCTLVLLADGNPLSRPCSQEDLVDPTHWRGLHGFSKDPSVQCTQNIEAIEVRPLTFCPGRPGRKSVSGLDQSEGFSHPFNKYETNVGSEPGPKRKGIGAVLGPYSLWIMRLVEPVV